MTNRISILHDTAKTSFYMFPSIPSIILLTNFLLPEVIKDASTRTNIHLSNFDECKCKEEIMKTMKV